jgi:hypothetical protein
MGALASCMVSTAFATQALAAGLTLSSDGWVSWEIPAVDDAPDWCCWSWNSADAGRQTCHIDRAREGYSNREDATTESIRVYARFAAGKIDRLRALSATCPVKAETEIRDLGVVAADDSARWLASLAQEIERDIVTRHHVGDDVLPTLAVHRGPIAFDALSAIARSGARGKQREQAVFWLALLRGREGADVVTEIMFDDKDTDVRKHAAFAVSKSQSPRAATDLMKLLTTDPSPDVREQAVFGLSQLPGEQATRALIAVAEDASLPRAERKRAVFWLSQSESTAAQAYMEKVLTAVASRP